MNKQVATYYARRTLAGLVYAAVVVLMALAAALGKVYEYLNSDIDAEPEAQPEPVAQSKEATKPVEQPKTGIAAVVAESQYERALDRERRKSRRGAVGAAAGLRLAAAHGKRIEV